MKRKAFTLALVAALALSLLGNAGLGVYAATEVPHQKEQARLYKEKFEHTLNGWNAQMQRMDATKQQEAED